MEIRKLMCCLAFLLLLAFAAGAEEACAHSNTSESVRERHSCQGYELVDTVCSDCGAVLSAEERAIPVTHENTREDTVSSDPCHGTETVETVCADCGAVLSAEERMIPVSHAFSEWEMETAADCAQAEEWRRVCASCGLEETESRGAPLGHAYGSVILLLEPACTEAGVGYTECERCGEKQEITVAPLGHQPVETVLVEPTAEKDGEKEIRCARCDEILGMEAIPYTKILYNNTVTSLGPCTRDLIGGNDWYRLTPLDLTAEGTYVYPLIASNRYTVGQMTATVTAEDVTVTYEIGAKQVRVNSETLIIYSDLEEVRNPQGIPFFELNQPISITENFGDRETVILSLMLRVDYDSAASGVVWFTEDPEQMEAMTRMMTEPAE